MSEDETQLTRLQLLARIEAGWEELQKALQGLDDESMTGVDPASGWAIKDHLIHLAAWEQGIAFVLTNRPRHVGMGLSAEQWGNLTMDEMNEAIYEGGHQRLAAESLANLREAHMEMLNALAELDDADLSRDYSEFDRGAEYSGRPIVGWIIGDTYEHYREHLGYIRAALGS